ncbi:MAG: FG-GAP repeat domain-containing protein, partial [Flavobacteriaceae bacterium]
MKYKFLYIFFISQIIYSQQFRNITNISDLNGFTGNNGVAVADYDQDGDLDIFIVYARFENGETSISR